MTNSILFMLALLAVGGLIYAITLAVTYLVRRTRQQRIDAIWEKVLQRAQKRHRQKMSRIHPSMKPWINQDTGRLHSTVR